MWLARCPPLLTSLPTAPPSLRCVRRGAAGQGICTGRRRGGAAVLSRTFMQLHCGTACVHATACDNAASCVSRCGAQCAKSVRVALSLFACLALAPTQTQLPSLVDAAGRLEMDCDTGGLVSGALVPFELSNLSAVGCMINGHFSQPASCRLELGSVASKPHL